MRLCPFCGSQNSAEALGCAHCGRPFAALDRTVTGHASPTAPSGKEARFRGTMIGLAPPGVAQPLAAPPAAADASFPAPAPIPPAGAPPAAGNVPHGGGLRQTMIGIAPLNTSGQVHSSSASGAPQQPTSNSGYPTPPPPPAMQPGSAPPAIAAQPRPGLGGTQPLISAQKTMLGVARPGIAPINPQQPKGPTPPPDAGQPAPNPAPAPVPPAMRAEGPVAAPHKPGIPPLAAVAMVGAAGLFAAAAVVWLFYHGHGAIEAHAVAATDGTEQLELNCAACEDGTVLRLDAGNAAFHAHHATLPLARPLKVGANPMTITLINPHGKQSFVDISVPIAYRVRGDTTALEAPTPELRVLVSALPGSTATVDGKPLTLNADGEGTYAIDVSAQLTGLDPTVKRLERSVPYLVTPPNASAEGGTVNLQTGITPLTIDAPGAAVVLESSNFVLAGRTAKAGSLTVGDRPITVDPTGRFAQMMNVSAPGETTIVIRAGSKDAAPRLFPLRVKRVDSFAHEAERVRQRATSNYAAISDQAEGKRGWAVALDGSVVDARTDNYNTVVVMDVTSGCSHAPCLARVVYGAPFTLARGDKFSAYGEVSGIVDGPRTGMKIPEIRANFLVKASK
ncbi:MAG: hypothetical protein ABJB12_13245 [Pseudomonadota bacterium]